MPRVRDRMVAGVVTIEPGTGVVDAAKRMIEEASGVVSSLPSSIISPLCWSMRHK